MFFKTIETAVIRVLIVDSDCRRQDGHPVIQYMIYGFKGAGNFSFFLAARLRERQLNLMPAPIWRPFLWGIARLTSMWVDSGT